MTAAVALDEAGRRDWDAVVVGAGPGGALAARECARRGLTTLLVERSAFPRRKVCGCCLSGRALAVLDRAGLGDLAAGCAAVPLQRLLLGVRGAAASVPLTAGAALSRSVLDATLAQEAERAGAVFLPETLAALADGGGGAERRRVRLTRGEESEVVTARVVVAADGLGGGLLARAGVTAAPPAAGSRIGAGAVAPTAPAFYATGVIYMACGGRGYLGLVRLEDGTLNLAAALDAGWMRARGGPGPAAAALLAEVGWPAPAGVAELAWRGTPALTRQAARLAGHRVFALGDAAGYVEPFTGEGMAWALAGAGALAPLAVEAACGWRPGLADAWARLHRRAVGGQRACRVAAGVLRRPRLARIVVHLLAHWPGLAGPVVRHLNQAPAPAVSPLPPGTP